MPTGTATESAGPGGPEGPPAASREPQPPQGNIDNTNNSNNNSTAANPPKGPKKAKIQKKTEKLQDAAPWKVLVTAVTKGASKAELHTALRAFSKHVQLPEENARSTTTSNVTGPATGPNSITITASNNNAPPTATEIRTIVREELQQQFAALP